MKQNHLNIGIHLKDFLTWNGGIDFIENIITSLIELSKNNHQLKIILLVEVSVCQDNPDNSARELKIISDSYLLRAQRIFSSPYNLFNIKNLQAIKTLLMRLHNESHFHLSLYHDRPWGLKLACIKNQINIIMPTLSILDVPKETKIVSYIYDLQHIHQPYNFSETERVMRNKQFKNFIKQSHSILCNSNYTAEAINIHYKLNPNQSLLILPFSPYRKHWWHISKHDVLAKYNIQGKYLIVCNQFWLHKNNILALNAFIRLTTLNQNISIVFTGEMSDYRSNKHIDQFAKTVSDHPNLDIKVLGMLPKHDQLSLLDNAELLIQPTTYEGGPGGGSVYDAMSLGTPVVLSDIPINKECQINEYPIFFFENDNLESLVAALKVALNSYAITKPINNLNLLTQAFDDFCRPFFNSLN